MKRIAVFALVMVMVAATGFSDEPAWAAGSGHTAEWGAGLTPRISGATPAEAEAVGWAVREVEAFYTAMGHAPTEAVTVSIDFDEEVRIGGRTIEYAVGIFDGSTGRIHMVHRESAVYRAADPLGAGDCAQLYASVIAHEIAHFMNSRVCPGLDPIADEFVAAYVQFSLLDAGRRAALMEGRELPRVRSFRDLTTSNYLVGASNFLLACYRLAAGRPALVERVLAGRPTGIKDPFLID